MDVSHLKQRVLDSAQKPAMAWLAVGVMVLLTLLLLASNVERLWFSGTGSNIIVHRRGYQAPPASAIPSMHLFGSSASDLKDLPLASLGLQVQGIFLNANAKQSTALISMTGQAPQRYNIGSMLPGNVKIYKITRDSVIVSHDNRLEKLPFTLQGIDFSTSGTHGGLF